MRSYRIYRLGADGRIKEAVNIDCASDEEAQEAAIREIGNFPEAEVWEGARRVARVTNPNPRDALEGVFSTI